MFVEQDQIVEPINFINMNLNQGMPLRIFVLATE